MKSGQTEHELELVDAYWRASNYLTIGQIYLQDNPLLREPLRPEHIKARLLGHWGTSPGQNLVYVHLNRIIRHQGASVLFVSGPGHGGPAIVAQTPGVRACQILRAYGRRLSRCFLRLKPFSVMVRSSGAGKKVASLFQRAWRIKTREVERRYRRSVGSLADSMRQSRARGWFRGSAI